MAREVRRFAATIPAGTAILSPATISLAMPDRQVNRIEVNVPPGPRGNVGFKLASGGAQMIPIPPGDFVVTDNEKLSWDLTDQITSGAWQLIGYNLGAFNHTLEVRFLVDLPPDPAAAAGWQPIAAAALSSGV